jgi:hypothetical protein
LGSLALLSLRLVSGGFEGLIEGEVFRDDKLFRRFLCILREMQQETRSVSTVHRGNAEIVYCPWNFLSEIFKLLYLGIFISILYYKKVGFKIGK